MESETIRWSLALNGVLTLTLNRPSAKNALDTAGQFLLSRMLYDASRHPEVKVVVLTGEGNAFCTGADVRSMGAPNPGDELATKFGQHEVWQAHEARVDRLKHLTLTSSALLHNMGKPTIAKLRGPASGLGFSLALACDFRLAADNAFLLTSFAKIGTSGDYGGSYFLTQLVGPSRAKEIYMFSERIGAEQALALGLLNRLLPDAELDAATDEFAARLANGPTLAYRYIKENIHAAVNQSLETVIDMESRNMIRCRMSDDCGEALKAFVNKAEPVFKGR